MGACYAVRLEPRGVDHIHAHHGYFGSWVAMVAARLLNLPVIMVSRPASPTAEAVATVAEALTWLESCHATYRRGE
jgi:hypothetical protein